MTNSLQDQLNQFTAACAKVTKSLSSTGKPPASTATTSSSSGRLLLHQRGHQLSTDHVMSSLQVSRKIVIPMFGGAAS